MNVKGLAGAAMICAMAPALALAQQYREASPQPAPTISHSRSTTATRTSVTTINGVQHKSDCATVKAQRDEWERQAGLSRNADTSRMWIDAVYEACK